MQLKAIPENCSGCRTCLMACGLARFKEVNPSRAVLRINGLFPAPGVYRIDLCDQCGACAEACPAEAITETDGVYTVDADLCTECLLCVEACPHGVMCTHPAETVPSKCNLCGACAEACPRGAIVLTDESEKARVV